MSRQPIPLTDHDLRQMDDEWVSALTSSEKESLLVRALFELRKSRDRLNQSPRNSSKPPSTSAPWETAASADGPSSAESLPDTAPVPAVDEDATEADKAVTPGKAPAPKPTGGKDAAKKKAGYLYSASGRTTFAN